MENNELKIEIEQIKERNKPVIGFTLSTLSLRFVRKIWEKRI